MDQMTLAEVKKDERFEGYLLVRASEQRAAASGKMFLDMTLADKTGSINAKMWDGTVAPPAPGSVVKVRATGNEFNGRMQLRVERVRATTPEDVVDMSYLVSSAPENPKDMYNEVMDCLAAMQDEDYKKIVRALLEEVGEKIMTFPAAKQMHHAERSGLLHHVTGMLRAAKALLGVYSYLDSDLLLSGIIIHDLAKTSEMDADDLGMVQDYTTDGKLIGHIIRGVIDIERAGERTGAARDKVLLLQHMVLSHHGIPEYGSPLPPKFPEAEVLHTLDTLDARLNEMQEALRRTMPGGFSEKVWGLENRQLYRIPDAKIENE